MEQGSTERDSDTDRLFLKVCLPTRESSGRGIDRGQVLCPSPETMNTFISPISTGGGEFCRCSTTFE